MIRIKDAVAKALFIIIFICILLLPTYQLYLFNKDKSYYTVESIEKNIYAFNETNNTKKANIYMNYSNEFKLFNEEYKKLYNINIIIMVLMAIIVGLNIIMIIFVCSQECGSKVIIYCCCLCNRLCEGCLECMFKLAVSHPFILQLLGLIGSISLSISSLIYSQKSRGNLKNDIFEELIEQMKENEKNIIYIIVLLSLLIILVLSYVCCFRQYFKETSSVKI